MRLENDTIFNKNQKIEIEKTLCMGDCKRGPNIKFNGQTHNYMGPAKASEIITK